MRVQSRGENSVNKGLEVEEHAGGVSSLCQLQDQAPGSGRADREVIASGGAKDEMQPMEGLISHKQTLRQGIKSKIFLWDLEQPVGEVGKREQKGKPVTAWCHIEPATPVGGWRLTPWGNFAR